MGSLLSNHHHELREMPHKVHQLHIAVMTNDRDTVKSLLAQGVNINYPWYNPSNPSVKDGNTALISAVSLNYFEIVQVGRLVHKYSSFICKFFSCAKRVLQSKKNYFLRLCLLVKNAILSYVSVKESLYWFTSIFVNQNVIQNKKKLLFYFLMHIFVLCNKYISILSTTELCHKMSSNCE